MKLLYLILFELITADVITDQATYRLPAEWEPHQRTLMAWPRKDVDGDNQYLMKVRKDIAKLAKLIAAFEPVVIFADPAQVNNVVEEVEPKIHVVAMEVDDFWTRDMSPVFVQKLENGAESVSGVIFNFNGYGNKQFHEHDSRFAKNVLAMYGVETITAKIVSEGGAFQTDGKGTLIVPKSSLVNKNRNNQTIIEIENELKTILGIRKVIWFNSVKGEDITDGHIDCLVRYVQPGVVLLSRPFRAAPRHWYKTSDQAYSVLKNSTDADGNPFKIIEVTEPNLSLITEEHPIDTTYLNFFIGNKFVAVPEYGDKKSDLAAQEIIQEQFPGRKVIPITVDAITAGGGGIRSATYQFPVTSKANNRIASPSLLHTSLVLAIVTFFFCNREFLSIELHM